MKIELIVRVKPDSATTCDPLSLEWIMCDGNTTEVAEPFEGDLTRLSQWYEENTTADAEHLITLLVPGSMASCHVPKLQEAQRKHWQQVVPYLLEERLAFDLESQHIVSTLSASADDSVVSSCISHEILSSLLEQFRSKGLSPHRVIPETQLFQGEEGTLSIWLENGYALVATDQDCAQLVDSEGLPVLLPTSGEAASFPDCEYSNGEPEQGLADKISAKPKVRIWSGPASSVLCEQLHTALPSSVAVEQIQRDSDSLFPLSLSMLFNRDSRTKILDFRVGHYKCARTNRQLSKWKPVAVLACIWLALEVGIRVASGFYFHHQADQLSASNQATYKELRPGGRRVVDIKSDLMKVLRDATIRSHDPVFLEVLKIVSRTSTGDSERGLVPKNIDYNETGQRISLDVQASSFEILNQHLETLRTAGLQVVMEAGNQESDRVSARLTVRKSS